MIHPLKKMTIMKRIIVSVTSILTVALLFVATQRIQAQQVNSLYFLEKTPFHTKWNPAMAPSRPGIGVGISSISLNVHSDLAMSDLFYPSADGTQLYTVLHPSVDKNAFISGLNDVSNIGGGMSMDLLNLGLKFGGLYLTFNSSVNTDMGIGLPRDLFKFIMLGTNSSGSALDLSALNINAMMYAKAGVGLSVKLGKMLSVGASANYLMGLADMRLGFDQFSIASSGSALNITTKGDLRLTAPKAIGMEFNPDGTFKTINFDKNYLTNVQSDPMGNLPQSGKGMSFDVGLTFKPLNFLTLSAAVIDFGSITWDPASISQAKSNGTFTYTGADLNGGGTTSMTEQLTNFMNLQEYTDVQAYTTKLTTKINVGVEAGAFNNHITIGLLSQTGISDNGNYQDYMASLNLKPGSLLQTSLSYSLLHGEMSSFGAAVNLKLLLFNLFVAADYIPLKVTPQYIPINNSFFNLQTGFNLMF